MWLLTLLPTEFLEFIVNAVLIIGVVSTILAFFVLNRLLLLLPPLASYYRIIQVVSLIILCAGIYFKGGYSVEKIWRDRVAELEAQIKVAEEKASEKNVEIQEKIVERTKVVKEKGDEIVKYVDRWNTKEVIKEIPGPERVKEITKDMTAEQKKAYEAEIEQLRQNQGRVQEVVKYIETCPVPAELVDLHNQAAKLNKAAAPPAKKEEPKK